MEMVIDFVPMAIDLAIQMLLWCIENPFLAAPALLIQYIALMMVWEQARDQWWEKPFKILGGIVFLPQDVFVNVIVCSVLFLDLPSKFLVTHRMRRYKMSFGEPSRFGFNWSWIARFRYWSAIQLCKILDYFERRVSGEDHC